MGSHVQGEGRHWGEASKLEARVEFLHQRGYTVTDRFGIHYHFYGLVFSEPKIYPSYLHGIRYPLYFLGQTMRFRVHLKNTSKKGGKKFKVRVNAVNYVLETSGFSGQVIAPGQDWIVKDLRPGEKRVLKGEIYISPDQNLPSGLDVTKVRIFHLNNGSNTNAGFIKEATAVWCPPDMQNPN